MKKLLTAECICAKEQRHRVIQVPSVAAKFKDVARRSQKQIMASNVGILNRVI